MFTASDEYRARMNEIVENYNIINCVMLLIILSNIVYNVMECPDISERFDTTMRCAKRRGKSRMAEELPRLESGNGECEDSASIICVRIGIVRYPGHR